MVGNHRKTWGAWASGGEESRVPRQGQQVLRSKSKAPFFSL